MVHQVLTGTLESPVDLEAKVCLETLMGTLEVLELKVSLESPGSQVAEPSMVFLETTDIQEFQVFQEQRGPLENRDVLGLWALLDSQVQRARRVSREEADQMVFLGVLGVLEVLEPKVYLDPLVWMDSMDLVGLKASLEPQVGAEEAVLVLQVSRVRRGSEESLSQDLQVSQDLKGREGTQVVLDSQGSLDAPDLLVPLWDLIFLVLWETLASLDLMENTGSKVLQVLPGPLVQVRLRETEETLVSQDSLVHLVEKESLASLGPKDCPGAPVLKESAASPASVEVLVSKVFLGTLVTLETRDQRDYEDRLVVREFLESRCRCRQQTSGDPTVKWAIPVKTGSQVDLENQDSLDCLGVQVPKVVQVVWENLAGPELLVFLGLLVTLDLLVSLDPLENKVFPGLSGVSGLLGASGAAPASDTRW